MSGYDAFKTYQAVRLHFIADKFDYFTYNGKSKTSPEAFNARKDKYTFHKVARTIGEYDLPFFFAVNFLKRDGKAWIAGMLQEEAFKVYESWKKWQEDRTLNLTKDLKKLATKDFAKLIVCKDGQFPELLNLVFQEEIAYDTLVILDHFMHLTDAWNSKIDDDFIWTEFYKKLHKYKPFFLQYASLSDMHYKKLITEYLKK
jgi:T4 gene Gp59 loader of gp41 DNA helicase/T4 gene Gp59 loader of gp41 DNA helicase C-term